MTINKQIGLLLRIRRLELGMSQDAVAKAIGVTFQQIQKYEKGTNALNVERLVQLAKVLNVQPQFFFDDKDMLVGQASERESLEMVKAFNLIKTKIVRKQLSDLARSLIGI